MFILRRFELDSFLKNIEMHQITDGAFVPPMVHLIISSPLSKKYSLKSIRHAHGGAAPLDAGSQAELKKLLASDAPFTQVWYVIDGYRGDLRQVVIPKISDPVPAPISLMSMAKTYPSVCRGMTETSCTCSSLPHEYGDETTGSVGHMLPNMDVKLCDDEGTDITADNVRGELCVRGPLVVQGYYLNPEANARDWDIDGFFHTGDIACECRNGDGKSHLWLTVC